MSDIACEWRYDIDGYYSTACGGTFATCESLVKQEFNYCIYCGLEIVETPYMENTDDNDDGS
jgi:hypothetical protein